MRSLVANVGDSRANHASAQEHRAVVVVQQAQAGTCSLGLDELANARPLP